MFSTDEIKEIFLIAPTDGNPQVWRTDCTTFARTDGSNTVTG
jgi:hypothetical protein